MILVPKFLYATKDYILNSDEMSPHATVLLNVKIGQVEFSNT